MPETPTPDEGSHAHHATYRISADAVTPTPGALAEALLRELDDAMKSPRGDYYQGDVADPHRAQHIVERHFARALTQTWASAAKIAEAHPPFIPITHPDENCGCPREIAALLRARAAALGGTR